MTDQEDQRLLQLVKKGNKKAFDTLVLKYQQRVIQLVSRYVHNPSDALDITQEAFIKAYRAIPNFRGDSAFYTWLYRIAVNTAKNHLVSKARRSANKEVEPELAEQFEVDSLLKDPDSPEHLVLTEEIRQIIVKALDKLPQELKQAITLRELEGLNYQEIAEKMDCPVGTVRSRIFRAREAIDKAIEPLINQQ